MINSYVHLIFYLFSGCYCDRAVISSDLGISSCTGNIWTLGIDISGLLVCFSVLTKLLNCSRLDLWNRII